MVQAAPIAAAVKSKMKLSNVHAGKTKKPLRIVVHGVEKIGKSTWAAGAPKPIFLPLDDGVSDIDVPKFPNCESFEDAMDALRELYVEEHEYQTLVVDPFNWLEARIWDTVCRRNNWVNIEAPGYGKGYTAAVDDWRLFLAALDRLRTKGMHVILIGHTGLVKVQNPQGEDYERNGVPIHKSAAQLFYGWADAILFAEHEIAAKKDKGASKAKAIDTGLRFFRTGNNAAYFSGNRYALPDPLPLEPPSLFWDAVDASRTSAAEHATRAMALAVLLGGDAPQKARDVIEKHGTDPRRMLDLCNRIQTAIDAKKEESTQ